MTPNEQQLQAIIDGGKREEIMQIITSLSDDELEALGPTVLKIRGRYFDGWNRAYGSDNTHRALNIMLLYTQKPKDLSRFFFFPPINILQETLPLRVPRHFPEWYRELMGKENNEFAVFWRCTYEEFMDWYYKGYVDCMPHPRVIASKLMMQLDAISVVTKYEITLQEHFWYLFEYECMQDKHDKEHTYQPYIALAERGLVDRKSVLRRALTAANSGLNKNLSSWLAGMFVALNPSVDEQIELQDVMMNVLTSPHSKPVNIILGLLLPMSADRRFDADAFLTFVPVLLASEVKAVHRNTHKLLMSLCAQHEDLRNDICCAAAQSLMMQDTTVQKDVIRLITKYGRKDSAELADTLTAYRDMMLTETVQTLAHTLIDNEKLRIDNYTQKKNLEDDEAEEPAGNSQLSIINSQLAIAPIESPEDFIFLASQVLDNNEIYHVEQFLAEFLTWRDRLSADHYLALLPLMQRAFNGFADHRFDQMGRYTARFLWDVAGWLAESRTDMAEMKKLCDKITKKCEGKSEYYKPPYTIRELKNDTDSYIDMRLFRNLYVLTLDRLTSATTPLPLLSTPTHAPTYLAPDIFIRRLMRYEEAGAEPDDMDMQLALCRLALDMKPDTASLAGSLLGDECRRLLAFLYGDSPQGPFTHESWWMTAGLIRNPDNDFFDFAYCKTPRAYLTGLHPWSMKTQTHTYDDYKDGKKIKREVVYHYLEFDFAKDENIMIDTENWYRNHYKYRSRGDKPLLSELATMSLCGYLSDMASRTDIARNVWFMPNLPEPILLWMTAKSKRHGDWTEVRETAISEATTTALLDLRHEWHSTSYLFLAAALLFVNKTTRSLAAEVWRSRVSQGVMDSARTGDIIGGLLHDGYAPLRRFALTVQQMTCTSPRHDRELERMLSAVIARLPDTPLKDTKKLLEVYHELRCASTTATTDEGVRDRLKAWQDNANLKKAIRMLKYPD